MAAEKAPAYQWYPKDYENDEAVKLMTYEQEGIYRRLLDHQALHGSIPAITSQIAMLVPKVSLRRFLALWPAIAECFVLFNGRLVSLNLRRMSRRAAVSHERVPRGVLRDVFARHGRRCVYCGAEGPIEIDHIVPLSKGGPTTLDNLQPLCRPCNRSKGAN